MKRPCKFASGWERTSNSTSALALPPGITILFGPSGAGKTTLLDCIAGLVRPDAGRIATQEKILFDSALGIDVASRFRRVGYVFQDLALFPHLTVESNVEYGLSALGQRATQAAQRSNSGVIPHCASARAPAGADFRWGAPASRTGPRPGDRSRNPSAG